MIRFTWPIVFLIIVAAAPGRGDDGRSRALAIAADVERIAGRGPLWPGFDPLRIPLAIYTGERTFLFRHPSPPEGFESVPDASPVAFVFAGRHPRVTANTSAEIGGVVTATLLADDLSAKVSTEGTRLLVRVAP